MILYRVLLDPVHGWRVMLTFNGIQHIDLCGAINESVARATATILNQMRSFP